MNPSVAITQISLFVCLTIVIKAVLETIVHLRIMREGVAEASFRALIASDMFQRRAGALRSGIALIAIAVGAALIEVFGWREVSPGAIAAIVAPVGVGELIYYFLSQRNRASQTPAL